MTSKANVISLALGLLSFFFVFNIFYAVVPPPLEVATPEDVIRFQPSTYVYPGDEFLKIVAWMDSWEGYKVIEYWYYWNYDGPDQRDDWEPVILLIKNDNVTAIASRIHYSWRVAYSFPKEGDKPVIVFRHLWHTPLFTEPPSNFEKYNITPVIDAPPEDVDYKTVFGFAPLPTQSAIASALIFGSIAGVVVYGVSRGIFSSYRARR